MSETILPNLDAALTYACRGWAVIPVHSIQSGRCSCERTTCDSIGKHPRTPHGLKDASTDEPTIRSWWATWPSASVAIVTGQTSRLLVVDIDPRHGGDESLQNLERLHAALPQTVEVLTGGGGRHLYFQHPGGSIKSRSIAEGVDIKADSGYVVAPPSLHLSGQSYTWEVCSHPDDIPLASLPPWLERVVNEPPRTSVAESVSERIRQGKRNQTLTSLAGTMRRRGMTREAIEAALIRENIQRCEPPLPDDEVQAIAASVAQYPPQADSNQKVDARSALLADPANRVHRAIPTFRFTELKALLAEPEEQRPWLVDRFLPMAGFSILGAKPKVGKSTLARNLALAVARGEPFLDRKTVAGPVVYVALEEKRPEVQRHFQRMGGQDERILIHVGSAPEEAIAGLADAIATHNPVLAIVDPLLKLARVLNANDYAEVSRVLEPLIDLARTSGCHVLCVHHLGKGERSGADALLGSTAFLGAVDTLVMMQRRDQIRIIETVQRYGEDLPETVVTLDPETGCTKLGGILAAVQVETCMQEVIEIMGEDERTERQIKDGVGGNQTTVAKAIRQLVEDGQLERQGGGRKNDPYRYRRVDRSSRPPQHAVPQTSPGIADTDGAHNLGQYLQLEEHHGSASAS